MNELNVPDSYVDEKVRAAMSNAGSAELPGVKVRQIGSTADYEVVEDYTYGSRRRNDNNEVVEYSITALNGFVYDRSSIPRIFWVIISKDDLSNVPPLFHDLLYANGGVLPQGQVKPYQTFQREHADDLFLELMRKSGVKSWRSTLAYQAVRRFAEFASKTKICQAQLTFLPAGCPVKAGAERSSSHRDAQHLSSPI